MKVGISLPIRELRDDLGAVKAFAQMADEVGYNHLHAHLDAARRAMTELPS